MNRYGSLQATTTHCSCTFRLTPSSAERKRASIPSRNCIGPVELERLLRKYMFVPTATERPELVSPSPQMTYGQSSLPLAQHDHPPSPQNDMDVEDIIDDFLLVDVCEIGSDGDVDADPERGAAPLPPAGSNDNPSSTISSSAPSSMLLAPETKPDTATASVLSPAVLEACHLAKLVMCETAEMSDVPEPYRRASQRGSVGQGERVS